MLSIKENIMSIKRHYYTTNSTIVISLSYIVYSYISIIILLVA